MAAPEGEVQLSFSSEGCFQDSKRVSAAHWAVLAANSMAFRQLNPISNAPSAKDLM